MSAKPLRLRGNAPSHRGPYPLAEIPDSVVTGIGRQIVHRLAVGNTDIVGDDFATIFSESISGVHREKPLGISDVVWNGCSWSVKTIKSKKPFEAKKVRLITGRNSPGYSYGIDNPLEDISKTGEAVLNIWNGRVNQSLREHDDLRVIVLIRSLERMEFCLFEHEAVRFPPSEYEWEENDRGNLQGYNLSGHHTFTWQPHGAQFTIIRDVPGSVYKFRIKRNPGMLEEKHVLRLAGFKEDWIERVK